MAFKSRGLSVFLLLSVFLALAGHALASRAGPIKQKEDEKKQPEWFIEPDGSVLIPGIGRILVPMPGHSYSSSTPVPSTGGNDSSPTPSYGDNGGDSGSTQIPGGDDTLVPNPDSEIPVPSSPSP